MTNASNPSFWNLKGHTVELKFGDLQLLNQNDLVKVLGALTPLIAKEMVKAKQENKKDWSVSGTVSTSSGGTTVSGTGTVSGKDMAGRDWSASVSASTSIGGGISGTGTVTTGSSGTSGTVGISGTF
jgi:hypothetical protein